MAAAVSPHPPLLVPGVAGGATGELDELRSACDDAVARLLECDLSLLVVVGGAAKVGPVGEGAWGSLAPYGLRIPVGAGAGEPSLPLSLTLGRWLLQRAAPAGDDVPTLLFGVEPDTSVTRCLALGEALAQRSSRVGLLVMGDGSARRSPKGPAGLDPDGVVFDGEVEEALRTADAQALAQLDLERGQRLLAAGRAPWQVLAGAALADREMATHPSDEAPGIEWASDVGWAGAPYGVGYLVATWVATRQPTRVV